MHQQVRQLIESKRDQIEMSNYLDYHKALEKQVAKIKNSVQIDKKAMGTRKDSTSVKTCGEALGPRFDSGRLHHLQIIRND